MVDQKISYEHCGRELIRKETWYVHDAQYGNYRASIRQGQSAEESYYGWRCGHLVDYNRQCYILCENCARLNGFVW